MLEAIAKKRAREIAATNQSCRSALVPDAPAGSGARIGAEVLGPLALLQHLKGSRGWNAPAAGSSGFAMWPRPFSIALSASYHTPNKAPEPTPSAVTPHAIEGVIELKQQNPIRDAARSAPAAVVAHL